MNVSQCIIQMNKEQQKPQTKDKINFTNQANPSSEHSQDSQQQIQASHQQIDQEERIKHNILPVISKKGTKWLRKRIQDYGYTLGTGRWSIEEDQIYADFMSENKEEFQQQYLRRTKKVFERLSEKLDRKRSSEQCRSHHQKMQGKTASKGIQQIITEVQRSINNRMNKGKRRSKKLQKTEQVQFKPYEKQEDQYKIFVERTQLTLKFCLDLMPTW